MLSALLLTLLPTVALPQEENESVESILDDLIDESFGEEDDDELFDDGLDDLLSGAWVDRELGAREEPWNPISNWKGYLETRGKFYTAGDPPGNDGEYYLEGELELDFVLGDNTTAYLRPRFRVSIDDSDANEFEPFEGYVTYSGSDWDLRAGQFVENWGIVDTYNPIDIVNRRDLQSDFLDADRLGELGVRWRQFFEGGDTFGEPTISLYVLPLFRRTPFPSDQSRFAFSGLGVPFDEKRGLTPSGSDNAFFAGRLQSTIQTDAANADFQFLVARGPERTPVIGLSNGILAPFYFGAFTVGGGLRLVPNADVMGDFLSTLTLKAEVAYKDPYSFDSAVLGEPADYLQYVLGVDRLFPNLITDGDQLTATIEYAGERGASDSDSAGRLRPFRSDFVLRGLWELNNFSRSSLEARAIIDTDLDENIYEFVFESQVRPIHDDLKLIAAVQVFDADDTEGLFSALPDNTSGSVTLRFEL